jgi:hypothetical protein
VEAVGLGRPPGEVQLDEVARIVQQPAANPRRELGRGGGAFGRHYRRHERRRQDDELQPGRPDRGCEPLERHRRRSLRLRRLIVS